MNFKHPIFFCDAEASEKEQKLALKFIKGFGMPRIKQLSIWFGFSLFHTDGSVVI